MLKGHHPESDRQFTECKSVLQIRHLIRNRYPERREFSPLNNRKINNPILKWAKGCNRHFSKEDAQPVASGHTKRRVASLVTGETPTRTAVTGLGSNACSRARGAIRTRTHCRWGWQRCSRRSSEGHRRSCHVTHNSSPTCTPRSEDTPTQELVYKCARQPYS